MNHADHVDLLRLAAPRGVWADFGSGTGAFTLALAELLGPEGELHSVDQDAGALDYQRRAMGARFPRVQVTYHQADFRQPVAGLPALDGAVMANALHFHQNKEAILRVIRAQLKPGGRFVLIEYNVDSGNLWVPHPLSFDTWRVLAARGGFATTVKIGAKPSRFLREIYSSLSQ